MQDKRAIGIGVIGLGFMGRTHMDAYAAARVAGYACRLRAVADRNAAKVAEVVAATDGCGKRLPMRLRRSVKGTTHPLLRKAC